MPAPKHHKTSRGDTATGPSQRQLRVGEELRHELARILNAGGCHEPELYEANITVTEVRCSPDLKYATVFVIPLSRIGGGGQDTERMLAALKRAKPFFRHEVAKAMRNMRYVPDLKFMADTSFAEAEKIETLLKDVQQ